MIIFINISVTTFKANNITRPLWKSGNILGGLTLILKEFFDPITSKFKVNFFTPRWYIIEFEVTFVHPSQYIIDRSANLCGGCERSSAISLQVYT